LIFTVILRAFCIFSTRKFIWNLVLSRSSQYFGSASEPIKLQETIHPVLVEARTGGQSFKQDRRSSLLLHLRWRSFKKVIVTRPVADDHGNVNEGKPDVSTVETASGHFIRFFKAPALMLITFSALVGGAHAVYDAQLSG